MSRLACARIEEPVLGTREPVLSEENPVMRDEEPVPENQESFHPVVRM